MACHWLKCTEEEETIIMQTMVEWNETLGQLMTSGWEEDECGSQCYEVGFLDCFEPMFDKVPEWDQLDADPTPDQVIALAHALGLPIDEDDPHPGTICDYWHTTPRVVWWESGLEWVPDEYDDDGTLVKEGYLCGEAGE